MIQPLAVELAELVPEELRDQIPELPQYGDMDVTCFLDSPYGFA